MITPDFFQELNGKLQEKKVLREHVLKVDE